MDTDPTDLSIVIPAFNEEARLPATMERVAEYCARSDLRWELIVVVEKSTDDTARVACEVAAAHPEVLVLVNQVQRGKGYALRTGVALASGGIVFTMDADLSVPMDHVEAFLDVFQARPEVQVLVGNRRHPESQIAVRQSAIRVWMGRMFNHVVRAASASRLHDTQCGFKAMRREAAEAIYSRQTIDGFACDVEVLMLAELMGFTVGDLPVVWSNSPESRVRIVRDSIRMLVDVLRVRRRVLKTLRERPLEGRTVLAQTSGDRG